MRPMEIECHLVVPILYILSQEIKKIKKNCFTRLLECVFLSSCCCCNSCNPLNSNLAAFALSKKKLNKIEFDIEKKRENLYRKFIATK